MLAPGSNPGSPKTTASKMSDEDREIEIAYKKAMTTFLEEGGAATLKKLADELAMINNTYFPALLREMPKLRGSIDRMPHTVRMRP